MGVPTFFRWLTQKYGRIIVDCIEAQAMPSGDDGEDFVDTDLPNPNGVEFDNLYLDFNGIVHQCAHPEDAPVPETEDEMCMQMFRYVDRLFNIVRPRKLLFIGVDGVAPRAKMNQQRSRRFRSAKEAEDKEIEAKRIATEFREQGYNVPDTEEGGEWDSNVITPGTPFMEKMVEFLRYYIHYSQSTKAGWKNVAVIVSDSNTPGEGEHKIMEYIRLQRAQPGYNPDTHHVIQGLDADLIMLALASHEQYFSILRENVDQNKPAPSPALNLSTKRKHGQFDEKSEIVNVKQFQLLHVSILREYLEAEFQGTPQGGGVEYPQGYDKERVIDDFIFLCFLCGNDFLPHLPSLDIREGGIDTLLATYKRLMPSMGGYLTENGKVVLNRVEAITAQLGLLEDDVFRERADMSERQERGRERRKQQDLERKKRAEAHHAINASANKMADVDAGSVDGAEVLGKIKQKLKDTIYENNVVAPVEDEVVLHKPGFKERYYKNKFHVDITKEPDFPRMVVKHYIEGVVWVLAYYYHGCVSWTWFYPFHYAPFASDFTELATLPLKFRRGEPFKPFEQLMAVLPPRSAHCLPSAHQKVMVETTSTVADFYPTEFKIDMNGARMAWMGVALLPFIDESRLLAIARSLEPTLSEEEKHRNSLHAPRLFVSSKHKNFAAMQKACQGSPADLSAAMKQRVPLEPSLTDGIRGTMAGIPTTPMPGEPYALPNAELCKPLEDNQAVGVFYFVPAFTPHKPRLLPGVTVPPRLLTPQDLEHARTFKFGKGKGKGKSKGSGKGGGGKGAPGGHMQRGHGMQGQFYQHSGMSQFNNPAARMIMHGTGNAAMMQHGGVGGLPPGMGMPQMPRHFNAGWNLGGGTSMGGAVPQQQQQRWQPQQPQQQFGGQQQWQSQPQQQWPQRQHQHSQPQQWQQQHGGGGGGVVVSANLLAAQRLRQQLGL